MNKNTRTNNTLINSNAKVINLQKDISNNNQKPKTISHNSSVSNISEPSEDFVRTKKNKRRRNKKNKKSLNKLNGTINSSTVKTASINNPGQNGNHIVEIPDYEVVYVTQQPEIDENDPSYAEFANIFKRFDSNNQEKPKFYLDSKTLDQKTVYLDIFNNKILNGTFDHRTENNVENLQNITESYQQPEEKLSNKKLRKLTRMTVAQLKQIVERPELVEWTDVTASDPILLVCLKSTKNAVPVPRHWCNKRKYLQGKRGIQKPPFDLPDYIKQTGIMEMRAVTKNRENNSTMAIKARERIHPKLGKMNIDYQRLHDAFFKYQTKPELTTHGELYYEGKELEGKALEKKPGVLSESLKAALNIPPLAPPPWLINMQRFGPPPSYPNLKIPGLNAPIPEGAQWGYHPGGWGKPPVDEEVEYVESDTFWGEVDYDNYYDEEAEEEQRETAEEETIPVAPPQDDYRDVEIREGMETPVDIPEIPSGITTPEHVELRKQTKRKQDIHSSDDEEPKQKAPYKVIKEKTNQISGFMGSQHKYELDIKKNREHQASDDSENGDINEKKYKENSKSDKKDKKKNSTNKKYKEFKF